MVKYARDNRYSQAEEVVTHDRNSWKAVSTEKLGNICEEKVQNCSVIGIDEGQFFSDVVEFSEKMANQGKVGCFKIMLFYHDNTCKLEIFKFLL